MQLLGLLLFDHFPLQHPVSVQVSIRTSMGMKIEGIGGLHTLELKVPVFHPEPVLEHLMEYDVVLHEHFYRLVDCELLILLLGLLQLVV